LVRDIYDISYKYEMSFQSLERMMSIKYNKIKTILFLSLFFFWMNTFSQTSQTTSTQSSAGGTAKSDPLTLIGTSGFPISAGKAMGEAGNPFIVVGGFIATLPEIDVQAPITIHSKLDNLPEGQAILISANITDNIAVSGARLWYRRGGDESFLSKEMQYNSGNYNAYIDQEYVTNHGVEYYLQAMDNSGNRSFTPSESKYYSIRINVGGQGIYRAGRTTTGGE
jgi:hypothetical protein